MTLMTFPELVSGVVFEARDLTPRRSVELGVIHGLCLDLAQSQAPHLIDFLNSVDGLRALSAALEQLPEVIMSSGVDGSTWTFVSPANKNDAVVPTNQ